MDRQTSDKLYAAACATIPGGVNSPVRAFRNVDGTPFFVRRAKGSRIWDVDGNELIDYVGTWWARRFSGMLLSVSLPQCITRRRTESALVFQIPTKWKWRGSSATGCRRCEKVRMVNSGTEATMSAIRLARGFTGRDRIIKFTGCYHGHVDALLVAAGSGALTHGEPDSAGVPEAFAELTIALPFNDKEAVEAAFQACGDSIAAVILEPVPANAGLFFEVDGFLSFLREITRQHGAVLIFDEVMTGFRVAKGGVQELTGITPDLTALGKVIGGGLPVGAFGGRADIMDQLAPDGPVYQAGTLSGNPLAMAAGLTQLKEMEKRNGWIQLEERGAEFETGVRGALEKAGLPWTFHRIGSMFCLFFAEGEVRNLDDAMRVDKAAFAKFFHSCVESGVYFAPSPYETGFLSLAHSSDDIAASVEAVEGALSSLFDY